MTVSRESPRLIMFPGLGADARLFQAQRGAFPELIVPDWLPARPGETLAEYGRRMAGTFEVRRPFFLCGVSFGGMVALEVARHSVPNALMLISSARSAAAIPRILRWYEALSRVLPNRIASATTVFAPLVIGKFGTLEEPQRALLLSMLHDTPMEFIRWGARAIVEWPGCASAACPIFHMHGEADRIIPVKGVRPDSIIPGAGHLVNVTHADAVNRRIAEFIARAATE